MSARTARRSEFLIRKGRNYFSRTRPKRLSPLQRRALELAMRKARLKARLARAGGL
jgi:hypothetical protein